MPLTVDNRRSVICWWPQDPSV